MRATLLVRDLVTLVGDSCVLELLSDILDPHFHLSTDGAIWRVCWGKHPSRASYGEGLKNA
jgi:hypothetical protein